MIERLARLNLPGALLVLLAIAAGAGVGTLSYEQSRQLILAAQAEGQEALAKGLAVGLADPLVTQDYGGMEARLEQAMADPTIASALVIDPGGKVLVHLNRPRPSAPTELLFQPGLIPPPQTGQAPAAAVAGVITRWTPIEAGAPVGWLELRLWSSRTDAVLSLLGRQYLVLGLLAATLIGGLMLVSQQQLRRQSLLRHERLHAEKEALDRTAHSDPLTGIWNRRGLDRELQRLLGDSDLRQEARLAICLIDLDDFKPVNDVYGHAVGDQLLVAVARRMRGLLREHDVLARLGGDEFIAVLRGCAEPELANKLAERIIQALNKPFVFGEMQVRVGASIGVALDRDGSAEPLHDLMKRADLAMYQAKQEGKGSVVVSPT